MFDREKTGYLHKADLCAVLTEYGAGLEPHEVDVIISRAKFDAKGRLTFDEFYKLICNDD